MPFKDANIGKIKAYWYVIGDKTGHIILSSDKELKGGMGVVRGQLRKTSTGTTYIRFKGFL